jgi:hypothetical protein
MDDKESKDGDSSVLNFLDSVKGYFNSVAKKDAPENSKTGIALPPSVTRENIDSEINSIVSNESGVDRIKELFRYE